MSAAPARINHQPALLLSATPWRESSLLAELFSRDYGRVCVVARSARKRQSELRGVLVPFVPVSVSWYGNQEIKTLHRAEWLGGWPQPQGRALFSALYANELVLKLTAREDPHPPLYDALAEVLRHIAGDNTAAALRRFEWQLLRELGFAPDIGRDEHRQPIDADARYWLRPEHTPVRLEASGPPPADGICVHGRTLLALAQHGGHDTRTAQEALQLTRMLLDFRLPGGIHSRRILQQLNAYARAV
ncbi:DNA repair protein RecO (recombination protein O) [Neisseria sp. HSC-16F19]|nr:DNA repair protein RecO [Neisseria sp. HSC-16F19]MCP2040156.1 DNA repair protein RecO (recombination protein O) [Neisseria sp. HSC-16F19]